MKKWWESAVFYELYMPSFKDSNNDGIGDFKGIIEKLDYLKKLGINVIWLTPFYESPKIDNGYDVSDYYSIDSDYGNMKDFERFLKEAHKRRIKVIIDIVLNHTSDEHKWFKISKSSKNNPYRTYYFWKKKPNNWESFFLDSAWEYDKKTGEHYYHKFNKKQVDLNWSNPKVKKDMFKILKFWIEKGVDGFRLDVINFLTVNNYFKNNPSKGKQQEHKFDINQKGIFKLIKELRSFVKGRHKNKVLIAEVGSKDLNLIKKYQGKNRLDLAFNFNFGDIGRFDLNKIFNALKEMKRELKGNLPTLFFSTHDIPRHISKFGENQRDIKRAKAVASLILTARGVPFIYYGDEIGMTDLIAKKISEVKDIKALSFYKTAIKEGKNNKKAFKIAMCWNRDKSRSPMQWNNKKNASFSKKKPWLKINDNYKKVNVETEEKNKDSLLNFYRKLIKIRKQEKALLFGSYKLLKKQKDMIYYKRIYSGEEVFVLINFGKRTKIKFNLLDYNVLLGEKKNCLEKNEVLILKKK